HGRWRSLLTFVLVPAISVQTTSCLPLSNVTVVATNPSSYSPLERTMPDMREWVELSSQGIQALAVVIIVTAIIFGTLRYVVHLSKRVAHAYSAYKQLLGRSLLLALELL